MKEADAVRLIRKTFEASFEREDFIHFTRELLNSFEDSKAHKWKTIKDSFSEHIASWERVGAYYADKQRIDLLIVHLKKETSLERARTMQRNFIAGYLRGDYGSTSEKNAALVAFVSADPADWRFSLVKLEYALEETEKGELKGIEKFTPARRWSFLVGANEKSHTAQSQLVKILKDDENNPTLERLEEAFDIELVSDEFFNEYRRLFIETKLALDAVILAQPSLKSTFEAQNINSVDFAKKLLGQIVFLYYLQKKGWFGVPRKGDWGAGSKKFLRELFEQQHSDYQNFFNDILEPLFYDALRNDRSHDDHYYRLFNSKIPFLNGGLFDPIGNYDWVNTDITLPNTLFSNQKKTKSGDSGDGILDIFDRYNFTVREDEPYEKEVAIDPELLGKAYEKFNAIRPDNFDEYLKAVQSGKKGDETKFNKQYGVYYTPREIVHYMCQQSLIQYLHTALNADIAQTDLETLILYGEQIKEHDARVVNEGRETKDYPFLMPESIRDNITRIDGKLAAITVCDPAVGSGAFPVGMMTEIVKARDVLSTYLPSPAGRGAGGEGGGGVYTFKRACIEHSLYGVDIDPGAVEIAKLRLWLSLVVDEDDIHHIKPLPNLDYKIVCGNSLIEIVSPEFLAGTVDPKRTALVARLKTAQDELVNLTHPGHKEQIRAEIETLILKLFENYKAAEIRKLEEKILRLRGQPGLFADAKITRADQKKLQTWEAEIHRLQAMQLPGSHEHFEWHINFSEVFDRGGFDLVIGNPPYIQLQKDGGALANLYQKVGYQTFSRMGDIYTLFYEKGFQILRKGGHLCFITSNKWMRAGYGKELRTFLLKNVQVKRLIDFGDAPLFENATTYTNILIGAKENGNATPSVNDLSAKADLLDNLTGYLHSPSQHYQAVFSEKSYLLVNKAENDLKQKVEKAGIPLKDWDVQINYGIKTGYNDAFIIDGKTRTKLIEADPKAAEIIKPVLRGKDIKRYEIDQRDEWIINTHNGLKAKKMPAINVQQDFPSVYEHLKQFLPKCEERADQGDHWTNLRNCTFLEEFDKEKIIWGNLAVSPSYSLDDEQAYIIAPSNMLTADTENLKYLTALLNSKLIFFIFEDIAYARGGNFYEFKKVFVEQLPIIRPPAAIEKKLENLVMDIQGMKKLNPEADTSALEAEIDQLVYQIYGLTDEEIELVEASVNK